MGFVLRSREHKNLQWPWEHEDGTGPVPAMQPGRRDLPRVSRTGIPISSKPPHHRRLGSAGRASHPPSQPGLCRDSTPQHKGTRATTWHRETSRTHHLPGLPARKTCLSQRTNPDLEVEHKGRGPKSLFQGAGWARPRDPLTGHSAAREQEMVGETQE